MPPPARKTRNSEQDDAAEDEDEDEDRDEEGAIPKAKAKAKGKAKAKPRAKAKATAKATAKAKSKAKAKGKAKVQPMGCDTGPSSSASMANLPADVEASSGHNPPSDVVEPFTSGEPSTKKRRTITEEEKARNRRKSKAYRQAMAQSLRENDDYEAAKAAGRKVTGLQACQNCMILHDHVLHASL